MVSRSRRPKLSRKWECRAQMMSVMFGDESNPLQRRPKYGNIESWKSRTSSQTRRATRTRTDLTPEATKDISVMNAILADVFALYLKTKNFHWHMSGHHFRDYHLLLDEQAEQLFAMTDVIAERVRKIGGLTLHSIGEIARTQRVLDNDAEDVEPLDMLAELADDNKTFAARLREVHNVCDDIETLRRQVSSKYGSMKPSVVRGSCSRHVSKVLKIKDYSALTELARD